MSSVAAPAPVVTPDVEPTYSRLLPRKWVPAVAVGFVAVFFGLTLLPRVREAHPGLLWAFLGWGGFLVAWLGYIWTKAKREGRVLEVELFPRKPHYVQMAVQGLVYGMWALAWPKVIEFAPLIFAQIVFAYLFDMALSWRRYGRFRLGFGPWPVTFSTNLFLWFIDSLFVFQFLMMALAYVSRDFIKWKRDGRMVHIFNPSAFGLAVVTYVLLAGEWTHLTWGVEVSLTLGRSPYCYEVIFLAGAIVMAFFPVVLVTMAAVLASLAMGWIYTEVTGDFRYIDTDVPIAVFLGMTLLVTDPVSSPRTNSGRVLFGVLYAASVFLLYGWLITLGRNPVGDDPGVNVAFADKLLFLPFLNLLAKPIDTAMRKLRFPRWPLGQMRTNLIHLGVWCAAFLLVRDRLNQHPGRGFDFWLAGCEEGKSEHCRNLLDLYSRACDAEEPRACHNLGTMLEFGEGVPPQPPRAAWAYNRACDLGFAPGCDHLGVLHVQGKGVPLDQQHAVSLFERACAGESAAGCYYLGIAEQRGMGISTNAVAAKQHLEKACALGEERACAR